MRKISDEMKAFANTEDFKKQLAAEKLDTVDDGRITQTRKYKLITPLFGGGVEVKKADPVKVIRETSIRGQLRFWWRAMRGTGTLEQMKKREDALFGSGGENASQSKILIAIKVDENGKIDSEGKPEKPFYMNPRNNKPRAEKIWEKIAYATFPLQPTDDEINKGIHLPMKEIKVGVEFTMEISFPKDKTIRKDIEATLWAWETFGGIGGRTRRGFGALQLVEIDGVKVEPMKIEEINPKEGESRIVRELREHLAEGTWDENVPHLSPNSAFETRAANSSKDAWFDLIEKLKKFRQARTETFVQTQNGQRTDYGRSYWTEPDAIRHRFLKAFPEYKNELVHSPKKEIDDPTNIDKFPRAAFGLPIVFHFMVKREDADAGLKEPIDTELKPLNYMRLSSPLILRPIACADGKAVGLALILETPKLNFDEIHLITSKNRVDVGEVETNLVAPDIAYIKPMNDASTTETDVLKSFLKTIK